jgi:5-methyltetrahydrofolate--homocysteine methyltransferase
MLIVGELINASRKAIAEAIRARHQEQIQQVAKNQIEAGANYIDVNAGVFVGEEPAYLEWLVKTVQSAVSEPCCIDSPDPKAIEAALAVHTGAAMINSISLEKNRFDSLLPIVAGTDLKVVALCMSDEGMPETADDRMAIADKLVNRLVQNNVAIDNIYVDPLVQPVSTNVQFGVEFLNAIEKITATFKGVHTLCGLSNVSFGLPNRKLLNQTFMSMAIVKGLDGAIVNPLDKKMMASIITAEALAGKDPYCMQYLKAYRAKAFEF